MQYRLNVEIEQFPLAETFTISRGSKTAADVLTCTITAGGVAGRGECVPYRHYGETMENVMRSIEAVRADIEAGAGRESLQGLMPPGAARNALDCALWDLEAKRSRRSVFDAAGLAAPRPVTTAYTLSLGSPDEMAAKARANAHRPLLKIKVGGEGDEARMRAVADAAPRSRLIVDANEGWNAHNIRRNLLAAAAARVALVEQPLPAGEDRLLRDIPHPVPICADESAHTAEGLADLPGLYDFVNIKLDKTGGLTAALELHARARAMGFGIMVGCMVGTSLAMAPALLLAQDADYVDLDGPLLMAGDREPALHYDGSVVSPPEPALWG